MNKALKKTSRKKVARQRDQVDRISALMHLQGQMPTFLFVTKDEAYRRAGCDPRAAMFLFTQ